MKRRASPLIRAATAALLALAFGSATAGSSSADNDTATDRYVSRVAPQYTDFAGSAENLDNLASGLRTAQPITLSETGPGGAVTLVTFTPPTRPMGYGNITRTLDLANRELAAVGITQPTPQQLEAALLGGTVSTPTGPVTLQGVLTLRSQGMGWGEIAHAIGVPPNAHASTGFFTHGQAGAAAGATNPGLGNRPTAAAQDGAEHSTVGITTAVGRDDASDFSASGTQRASSHETAPVRFDPGIVNAMGGASGTPADIGRPASGLAGSAASTGITNASGSGFEAVHGHAFARGR